MTAARFAPDGATVYYSASWDGLPPEVFATRPESRESQGLGLKKARVTAAATGELAIMLPTGAGQPIVMERGAIARYQWACWFPDGQRVLISASEEGQAPRAFVQNVAGGPPRPLGPPGLAVFRSKTIAPDGSAMVAECPREVGAGLCLVPFDGRPAQPLPALARGSQPLRWSADGRYLFLRGPRAELPVRVRSLEPATGRIEAWLEVGSTDLAGVSNVSDVLLSADGRHYVFPFQRTISDLYLIEGLL